MLFNLFLITIITVIVIDLSGFIDSIKCLISKMLKIKNYNNIHLKPFDCSFCMNFWLGLSYLLYSGNFSLLNLTFILLLSFLTVSIKDTFILLQDLITKLINIFY